MTPSHTPIMDEMFPSPVGETPRPFNVCRCIPHCEIVFSVIAVSIYAFLPVLSHSGPPLLSLACPPPSNAPRPPFPPPWPTRTCSDTLAESAAPAPLRIVSAFPNFSLSLTHIDSPPEHVGVQNVPQSLRDSKREKKKKERERKTGWEEEGAFPDDGGHLMSGAEGRTSHADAAR